MNFGIVLAAGKSTRMGTCKTSLPWGVGKTLLTYQLEQWLSLGFTPVVVLGLHNSHKQKDCLPGSLIVINPHSNAGKTTSLLTGLQHVPQDFEVLAISAVDQPRKLEIYQKLITAHQDNCALITAPIYKGKMGHPLLFNNQMRSHLQNIRDETLGLRQIIQEFYPVIYKVEFNDTSVLLDINTPEIYKFNYIFNDNKL
ncbi:MULTISPECIES: NTP transferase domain-containing protein [Nostoc]|uniref:Nucleotidyltransferase family protein n=1 Tax=Nostoc paludosum FACHB-159 TaxID=2692908 RepID=A0ABR8K067_9NOSO|nr:MULTISPECIES: NTP transferase domain-containing protein [Nostoc]MBD2683126.1 nucleotidyltransferase family protein [Nostoc sp. FACHB-857]MBD2732846.1 nucleotidyltransferase family protein [Nostoc paludosum FACHB-159]